MFCWISRREREERARMQRARDSLLVVISEGMELLLCDAAGMGPNYKGLMASKAGNIKALRDNFKEYYWGE